MIRSGTLTFVLISILNGVMLSQPSRGGTIMGQVHDADLQMPLEYANIVLYRQQDSTQVTGTITDQDGVFRLTNIPAGTYYIEFYFLGYETKLLENITLSPSNREIRLERIYLKSKALDMAGIEVEGESPPISFQIDKKVVNVDQHYSSISGSAVDVLENVPSISVDIEGNVSLRGSGSFRVLIDGRPSVLDASDALQQIPASTIDDIEIITNPSAKYDPEGAAGIINIILKKTRRSGRSGIANLNAGMNDKYGGDVLMELKEETYSAVFSVDYNHRFFDGESREETRTTSQGSTFFTHSDGASRRGRTGLGLRGSLEFHLSPRNLLSVGGRYGDRSSQQNAESNYDEWSDSDPIPNLYTSTMDRERSGYFYAFNTSYRHRFPRQGHEFTADIFYSYRDSDEETTNQLLNEGGAITSGQRSTEAGPSRDIRLKADYTLPLTSDHRFEAGYQSEFDHSDEDNGRYEFDPNQSDYIFQPRFSNFTAYDRNIHSAYTLYSGEWNGFGYQGGFRAEYTDRAIEFSGAEQPFTIDRWDYFPTFHSSYQFSDGQQLMASYTRRIRRPRGWQLEPYETWMDAYTVRVGNPALKPQYINSYELGYQTYFGRNLFSAEVYYRHTTNKIERVRSVYDANITLHTIKNIGSDYSLGSELLVNLDMSKKWNVNWMTNLYQYRVEGVLYEEPFSRESFNWGSRLRNSIKIGSATQVQLDGYYRSPTVSSQGRREGFFITSAAIKHEFLQRQLSVTLQVRDIFSSGRFEYTSEGAGYYSYRYGTRESPIVMLNIRYNYNNYKPERQRRQDDMDGDEEF